MDFEWTYGKTVLQELTDLLFDDTTGCKKVDDNDDFPQKQTQ